MTTALEGGEGSASHPGHSSSPGKTRYPLYRRMGGPQGRSGQVRKISSPPEFDPRTVQPVASRYTDYATRPTVAFRVVMNLRNTTFRGKDPCLSSDSKYGQHLVCWTRYANLFSSSAYVSVGVNLVFSLMKGTDLSPKHNVLLCFGYF